MTDATTIPPHLGKLGAPTGTIPTTLRIAYGRGAPWADVNRHDPFHAKYGVRYDVRPSMLKAMEVIESGGQSIPNGNGYPNFGVMQLTHSWNGGPKTKWERVAEMLGLPFREPEGQIAVAAYVLGGHDGDPGTPEDIFLSHYYPTPCLDCPGQDGHTPRQYLEDMKELERLITAAATGVSPLPTPVLFPQVRVFHVPAGVTATAREAPNLGSPVVTEFEPGTAISSDGYYMGEEVEGEARWLRTSGSPHLAIHKSGLSEPIVEEEGTAIVFGEEGTAMVFGNVPDPGINTRIINKPELAGWNDRGPRNIVGVCVHRMLGTLQGTEGHFSTQFDQAGNPNFGWRALTDFGIGGEMDPGLNGAIWQWNPLNGSRSPWANGWGDGEDPWEVTEGHGREFLQKWIPQGYDLNRDLASIELSGCSTDAPWCGGNETPVTPAQLESLSHLIAYVCDRFCQISHEDFPFNPRVGPDFYAVYQHYEFAGKDCPFPTVKALHGTYVERAREIMKQYQTDWAPEFVPFGEIRVFTVQDNVHASGRQAPSRGAELVRSFDPGVAIECDGVYTGETVQGDPRWLRTSDPEHLAIHISAFVEAI